MSIKNSKHAQQLVGFNTDKRPKGDFFPSPPIAVQKLLDYEQFDNVVWEPACGNGVVSEVLKSYNYDVLSTDLYDWGYGNSNHDFLKTKCPLNIKAIITNPPFNISTEFVNKALEDMKPVNGKVAILQRLAFLESKKRQFLFKDYPFSKCLVFSSRLPRMHRFDFEGKKSSSMIAFAWFIFDWQHSGSATIDWI